MVTIITTDINRKKTKQNGISNNSMCKWAKRKEKQSISGTCEFIPRRESNY